MSIYTLIDGTSQEGRHPTAGKIAGPQYLRCRVVQLGHVEVVDQAAVESLWTQEGLLACVVVCLAPVPQRVEIFKVLAKAPNQIGVDRVAHNDPSLPHELVTTMHPCNTTVPSAHVATA